MTTGPARRALLPLLLLLVACRTVAPTVPGPRSAPAPLRPLLAEGDELVRTGQGEAAVAVYLRAVEADPASVPAHRRYVGELLREGRRSEARRVYRERAAAPTATEADRTMARRLESDGSSSALRRVYALAAEAEPAQPWWRLALVEIEASEADAWNRRRLDAIDRGDRDDERHAFAQAQGALARADLALERARALAPDLAEVHLWRGVVRAVEGDLQSSHAASTGAWRAAEAAFLRAVNIDIDLVEAWAGLGDARLRTGDLDGSVRAWREAVHRSPADPALREGLGAALHVAERHHEAVDQFEEAARLDPRAAWPWLRMGDAWADEGEWERALVAYRAGLARDAYATEAHYKMGAVLERLDRPAEARAAYERYLQQGGEHGPAARRRLERLLEEAGP